MIEVRPRSLRGVERTHGRLRQALLSAPTLVSVLLAASVIARILMARHVLAPWAMGDELRHSELANSFVATRHYVLREQPYHLPSIYPALISPAWLADSMKTTYALAKGFNVALMTAAAIPLYAWARRLVRPAYAILAVGVYLAIPSFVYTPSSSPRTRMCRRWFSRCSCSRSRSNGRPSPASCSRSRSPRLSLPSVCKESSSPQSSRPQS